MKEKDFTATTLAEETIFSQLHVVEFWMPQILGEQNCNLKCKHCYVPAGGHKPEKILSLPEYQSALKKVMSAPAFGGKWDVVFPGMEPLLHPMIIFPLAELASALGARSIGMTTNGVLLRNGILEQVINSPINIINISLDGANAVTHNTQRRASVFDQTINNLSALAQQAPKIRVVTNSTITRQNYREVGEMVFVAHNAGASLAAFHPFEVAENADNRLMLNPPEIVSAIKLIIESVENGAGSAAIEFEPGTVGSFLSAWNQNIFTGMKLVIDETGFLFFWKRFGKHEVFVNLMFYPHHFIRTLRVMDDGSFSSCRRMAKHGWEGVGNIRGQSLAEIRKLPEAISALAQIWQEFIDQVRIFPAEFKLFTKFMERG